MIDKFITWLTKDRYFAPHKIIRAKCDMNLYYGADASTVIEITKPVVMHVHNYEKWLPFYIFENDEFIVYSYPYSLSGFETIELKRIGENSLWETVRPFDRNKFEIVGKQETIKFPDGSSKTKLEYYERIK